MCHIRKTLSQNSYGHLAHCEQCQLYHLQFNNIHLEFTFKELEAFKRFVTEIDVDYWESCCQRATLKRRIPIQTLQQNLAMVFNRQELESLKALVFGGQKVMEATLRAHEIDYIHVFN